MTLAYFFALLTLLIIVRNAKVVVQRNVAASARFLLSIVSIQFTGLLFLLLAVAYIGDTNISATVQLNGEVYQFFTREGSAAVRVPSGLLLLSFAPLIAGLVMGSLKRFED